MPIYEYRCADCGTRFEKLLRRLSAEEIVCPSCDSKQVNQQLSVFATHAGRAAEPAPSCPAGMCRTPDLCGRN